MSRRRHLRLFAAATGAWLAFWVIGLPSYYQQYSPTFMAWFDAVLLVAIIPLLVRVLHRAPDSRRMSAALWIAFYFTVPLAVYDWLYCGAYLGNGKAFLWRYWYVTVYYAIPWIVVPGVAVLVNRRSNVRQGQGVAETRHRG